MVLVHREQQHSGDARVQVSGPAQEADAVVVGQVQLGSHQRDLVTVLGPPLQVSEPRGGRTGCEDPVVPPEPVMQCRSGALQIV